MGSILKEVRVRGYYQDRDIKVTIEKAGLFNKKRKVYTTFWGKNTYEYENNKALYDWGEMEFVIDDLTEDNDFGDYKTYYEDYIKKRDASKATQANFGILNSYQTNNLEFSSEWNTDLDIIKLYILINTEKSSVKSWSLIEDPIEGAAGGVAPYYRSFGTDAYHLNNGAEIYIQWQDGNLSKGGVSWSDKNGKELKNQDLTRYNTKYLTKDIKVNINKTVSRIVAPVGNSAGDVTISYDPRSFPAFSKEFKSSQKAYGTVDDIDMLNELLSRWRQAVPGYESLEVIKNSNGIPIINKSDMSTVLIEYKSPLGLSASGLSASDTAVNPANEVISSDPKNTATIFKPTLKGIEDGFQTTAKTDLPNFSIYVGDPDKDWPKVAAGDLPEDGESFENVEGAEVLDDEYMEENFAGEEETEPLIAELQNIHVIESLAEANREAESLPPVDPNDPNPFLNAKGSGIAPSTSGIGYPVNSSTTKFVNKHTNGIYPAKQHADGTFVIQSKESGNHKNVFEDRHWLKANPQYVKLMASVVVPLASGTSTITVHPEFANKLRAAFKVIKERGLNQYLYSCAGGLAIRNVTNGTRLSNHSYGFAIDVNSTKSGWEYGAKWNVEKKTVKSGKNTYAWGAKEEGFYEIVKIMKGYGIGWLGQMDPMHFSMHE